MGKKTIVLFKEQVKKTILKAVNVVYDATRMSMGPYGGNALIYGVFGRDNRITNDGVTIAGVIEPKDACEKLVVTAFIDAAKKTNQQAGDGTTATVVIAGKLLNDIFNQDTGGEEFSLQKGNTGGVIEIKKDILKTADMVIEKLKESVKKIETIEDLKKIAKVSVEDGKLGDMVADMSWEVKTDGFIDVSEGHKGHIETEIIKGARFPAKTAARIFVNDVTRYEMVGENLFVLLTNYKIDKTLMGSFLQNIQGKIDKLAVFAPEFTESSLKVFAQQNIKVVKGGGDMPFFPVKVPSLRTEQFEDLSVYMGAKFFNKDAGDKPICYLDDLGFVEKLVVKDSEVREDAMAIGGKGETQRTQFKLRGQEYQGEKTKLQERIEFLTKSIEETREESHKNLLRRRIAGLSSAIGVIRVSAPSDSETYYLKKKIEDAVYACKAAMEEGYVKGGGLALKEIADTLPEDDILRPALIACYDQIQENAGGKLEIGEDIIDPVKAIRLAVLNAVSVAAALSTVKVIIAEQEDRNPAEGYSDIANAIHEYNLYWAKEKGIITENEMEIEKDNMARHDMILRTTIE